jgi:ATP-dependent DNA ligase
MKPLVQKQSPWRHKDQRGSMDAAELVAEVNYRGPTATGELRHASFKTPYTKL